MTTVRDWENDEDYMYRLPLAGSRLARFWEFQRRFVKPPMSPKVRAIFEAELMKMTVLAGIAFAVFGFVLWFSTTFLIPHSWHAPFP